MWQPPPQPPVPSYAAMDPDYRKRKSTKKNPQPKMHLGQPGDEMRADESEHSHSEDDGEYVLGGQPRLQHEQEMASKLGVPVRDDRGPLLAGSTIGTRAYQAGSPPRTYEAGSGSPERMTMTQYKNRVVAIIKELFAEEDYDEARAALEELHCPFFGYEFVRRAVALSMDHTDAERELVSRMLSFLYGVRDLSMEQIGKGFERLFETIDDLLIDVPTAREMAAKFLARAVADEILPPAFLTDRVVASLGGEIVDTAKALLSVPNSSERLEKVWHVTGVFTVPELKKAITLAVQEYLVSDDKAEAARCIKELEVPHYHHEVVYRLLVLTLDQMPSSPVPAQPSGSEAAAQQASPAGKALALLVHLRQQDVISEQQLTKGFERVHAALPDIKLDAPAAMENYESLVHQAIEAGVLPARFAAWLTAAPAHSHRLAAGQASSTDAQAMPRLTGTIAGAGTGHTGATPVGMAHAQHTGAALA